MRTNNSMSEKVTMSYNELKQIKGILKDLMGDLKALCEDPNLDLSDHIGQYAREMPKFKIFVEQADFLKTSIRKVCTREVDIPSALQKAEDYYILVSETLNLYNANSIEALLSRKSK